jgi:hypothetical protein
MESIMQDEEHIGINETIDRFFAVFTNTNGRLPDIDALYHLCIAEASIMQKTGNKLNAYTVDVFASSRRQLLSDGTLTEFEEHETMHETKVFHHIAQRNSRYEKSGVLNGQHFSQRGCKLFQLVKLDGLWKISALIWEDEAAG